MHQEGGVMQIVNVEARGGMVALTVEVGERKVVALLGDEDVRQVLWEIHAARTDAACQREKRRGAEEEE